MDNLVEQLKELIVTSLRLEDVDPTQIDSDAPLFGSGLGLSSIDALELVVAIEAEFGVIITDIEASREAFASVNTLTDLIRERVSS